MCSAFVRQTLKPDLVHQLFDKLVSPASVERVETPRCMPECQHAAAGLDGWANHVQQYAYVLLRQIQTGPIAYRQFELTRDYQRTAPPVHDLVSGRNAELQNATADVLDGIAEL
jgi:hypothetical protein